MKLLGHWLDCCQVGENFPDTSFSLEWELCHFRGLWLLPRGFQSFGIRSKVGLCPLLSGEDLRLG